MKNVVTIPGEYLDVNLMKSFRSKTKIHLFTSPQDK